MASFLIKETGVNILHIPFLFIRNHFISNVKRKKQNIYIYIYIYIYIFIHAENYKRNITEGKSPYGLQINKQPSIQTISLDFLVKWNSVLGNAERQLIELLLTEAKVVSKAVEEKFERKLRKMFPKNFIAARNKVKQQSKTLVISLRNRRHKKWLNIRRKESGFQSS